MANKSIARVDTPVSAESNRAVFMIAVAQLLGTSLWFSANGAMRDIQNAWSLSASDIGWLTNAVQIGFIVGTLLSATTGIADRFPASRIFALCGLLGASLNGMFALASDGFTSALVYRFGVGVALAGIYPIGMKLLVTWAPTRAAQALALLVGMLTLGTSSVHAIRATFSSLPWQTVVISSSALAVIGALMVLRLGDGPHVRRRATMSSGSISSVFRIRDFRASALGYFGHMWELYAFWTLTPLLVHHALSANGQATPSAVAFWSFAVIAIGAVGCVVGGTAARTFGSAKVAAIALGISGAVCAIYPFAANLSTVAQLSILSVWGISVIADSPQFSALSVKACPADRVGGALTIQNSLGFFLSACSILWATSAFHSWGVHVAWILLPGPLLGLLSMGPLFKTEQSR